MSAVAVGGERGIFCCASVVGCGVWVSGVMAVGIIRLLKSQGTFTWEAVRNEAAKGAPVAITRRHSVAARGR